MKWTAVLLTPGLALAGSDEKVDYNLPDIENSVLHHRLSELDAIANSSLELPMTCLSEC